MDTTIFVQLGVIFAAVASATGAGLWFLTDPQILQRRLSRVAATTSAPAMPESVLGESLTPMARRVRSFVPKSPVAMGRIERLMAGAGYHGPWPTTLLVVAQVLIPALLFLLVLIVLGPAQGLVLAIVAAAIGYQLPMLWLARAIEARRREIQNGLPDAIDLLIVCIESGSGLDQSINRVAEEIALSYPALARELELISAETRAGKPRLEAFRNFADRSKVEDVRSLVAMLVQTDRFGTSVGQALRTHADTSRSKRRQRAEERAAKLGVKLLFPLVFCLLPAFYVVVLGPSMIRMFRQFVLSGE